MERKQGTIEPAIDENDHEITQEQADIIAVADALLAQKDPESQFSFLNISLVGDQEKIVADIHDSPLSYLLAGQNDQLAIESDGSYYPQLDIRKADLTFQEAFVRAWGWQDRKVRHTDTSSGRPYSYVTYDGEFDTSRQLDLVVRYTHATGGVVVETASLHTTSARPDSIQASSDIWMSEYAETGYEGHKRNYNHSPSSEEIVWMLDFIARHVDA